MSKKIKPDDEDKRTFEEAMQGIRPHIHTKITPRGAPQKKRVLLPPKEENIEELPFGEHSSIEPVLSDDFIHFSRSGISHKTLRNLRKGQYNVEALLDLHGKSVIEARKALSRFLIESQQQEIRHVLIIHGKGHAGKMPILKNKLNHWLRQTQIVLAFSSALPCDGGSGALYVLLRR